MVFGGVAICQKTRILIAMVQLLQDGNEGKHGGNSKSAASGDEAKTKSKHPHDLSFVRRTGGFMRFIISVREWQLLLAETKFLCVRLLDSSHFPADHVVLGDRWTGFRLYTTSFPHDRYKNLARYCC